MYVEKLNCVYFYKKIDFEILFQFYSEFKILL